MSEQALTDAITDAHAEVDGTAEDEQVRYLNRIRELLENPNSRNLQIWNIFGVDKYLWPMTDEGIEKKNKGLRDDVWRNEIAGLLSACAMQARVEILYRKSAEIATESLTRKTRAARNLSRSELKKYASTTRRKVDFDAARARRANGKAATRADNQS